MQFKVGDVLLLKPYDVHMSNPSEWLKFLGTWVTIKLIDHGGDIRIEEDDGDSFWKPWEFESNEVMVSERLKMLGNINND